MLGGSSRYTFGSGLPRVVAAGGSRHPFWLDPSPPGLRLAYCDVWGMRVCSREALRREATCEGYAARSAPTGAGIPRVCAS